ncbi:GNAT family N-acetyltransferase [Thalassolituus oleivorans]|uniref:Putative acetyltransferase (GNAT-family protein) n=1 Tax=Thalassolituus oleivorans MIL-1 TaxID=1298593 RepID=M5DQB6_9GAMM|nr:GNAT family N-acetyltransferase [Thalassolituus oleivorans]CCU71708.1 putative acetyltransferase (GNAT-family protein) [Thalassolituus oleivorans MIL-1]
MSVLIIERLKADHNKSAFSCGNAALNNYIRRQAKQDETRNVARVYVATNQDTPNEIIGFYTLSNLAIDLSTLPLHLLKKLPKHPLPAVLLGRLAVVDNHQGEGVGALLLADAIKRVLEVSQHVGVYAVVVDAIDDQAARFYQHFGFKKLATDHNRWFLPLSAL